MDSHPGRIRRTEELGRLSRALGPHRSVAPHVPRVEHVDEDHSLKDDPQPAWHALGGEYDTESIPERPDGHGELLRFEDTGIPEEIALHREFGPDRVSIRMYFVACCRLTCRVSRAQNHLPVGLLETILHIRSRRTPLYPRWRMPAMDRTDTHQ